MWLNVELNVQGMMGNHLLQSWWDCRAIGQWHCE